MSAVAVTSLGAFTPVGVNVPQTMGSLLSQLQWFDDLDLIGPTGEPVSGARVRLSAVDDASARYVAMARFALAECRESAAHGGPAGRLPLYLATSSARDLPCAGPELLERVLHATDEGGPIGEPLDRRASRVFAEGRRGALHALEAACALVASGAAPGCFVGGVDSLLDPVRLQELLADGRLIDGSGNGGFVPAEAAVFLKLEKSSAPRARGVVLEMARADEPGPVPPAATPAPSLGTALAQAAREVLRLSQVSPSSLAALVHDGSSAPATVEEIALALTRLPFAHATSLRPWAPALSVGETGAAAAALSIAMTAFFAREGVWERPALVWLMSETTERAAIVVAPAASQGPRRG